MLRNKNYVFGKQDVPIPAHLNFGKYMLDRLRDDDEIAIENIDTKDKVTYKELKVNAINNAILLFKLGIKRGDIVAVCTENRKECMPLTLGVIFVGAILNPYDINSGGVSFKHNINITQPKYFICSKKFLQRYHNAIKEFDCVKMTITFDDSFNDIISLKNVCLEEVDMELFEPVLVHGQDAAMILFSSGTTGLSKGLEITHLSCILDNLADDFSNDKTLQVAYLPATNWHDHYGTLMACRLLVAGKKILYSEGWITENVLRGIQEYGVNIIFILPSSVSFLMKEGDVTKYNLDSLKIMYSTASPLHKDTIQKLKQSSPEATFAQATLWPKVENACTGIELALTRGCRNTQNEIFPKVQLVQQGYGMTEVGFITSAYCDQKGHKEGSVGKAVPTITLKVVDVNTRQALGPNQRGEICVRGLKIMTGYIGIDSTLYFDEEGFLKTGDLGYYDEDGYFCIVGRIKDIIDFDGFNVSPVELETIIQLHPGVREAGVVGKPHPDYAEVPVAFVVKEPGVEVTEQELVDYVAQEVLSFMQLRGGVHFIEEIPRNSRGKILRQTLKGMLIGD